jgi:SulP family sulfate permease
VPPALGIPIYLASGLAAQVATIFGSGVSFATGGTTIEVMPLLMPIAALAEDSSLDEAQQASTLLAMYALTSATIGLMYVAVARLRFGGVFRCIPLIVLKAALTGPR